MAVSAEVEALYLIYPRKVKKKAAFRAIEKALKEVPFSQLVEAVTAYREVCNRCSKREFIPYPATWFNSGQWDDDPVEWETQLIGSKKKKEPYLYDEPVKDYVDQRPALDARDAAERQQKYDEFQARSSNDV